MSIPNFNTLIERYEKGGDVSKRNEKLVSDAAKKSYDNTLQSAVSANLGGMMSPVAEKARFDQNVGTQFERGLDVSRIDNLINAMLANAGFLESEQARKLDIKNQRDAQDRGQEDYFTRQHQEAVDQARGMSMYNSSTQTPLSTIYSDLAAQKEVYSGVNTRSTHEGGISPLTFI